MGWKISNRYKKTPQKNSEFLASIDKRNKRLQSKKIYEK